MISSIHSNDYNKKDRSSGPSVSSDIKTSDYALFTRPERRQRVQTFIVLGVPSTTTLTL